MTSVLRCAPQLLNFCMKEASENKIVSNAIICQHGCMCTLWYPFGISKTTHEWCNAYAALVVCTNIGHKIATCFHNPNHLQTPQMLSETCRIYSLCLRKGILVFPTDTTTPKRSREKPSLSAVKVCMGCAWFFAVCVWRCVWVCAQ